jgi:hypothetical protein
MCATQAIISADEVAKIVPATVAQAAGITIADSIDYELACSFLTMIAGRKKQVGETFDPIVKKSYDAWQEAIKQRKKFLDPLETAEADVKKKVATWHDEQERLRREQEQRDTQAAREAQEAAALQEAAELEANGEKELAQMVLEDAAKAPAPVVVTPSSVPKQAGIAKQKVWKWRDTADRVQTLRALVKAAAKDDRWLAYLALNESAVTAAAKSQKDLAQVPGIQFYAESGVSVRSR